MGVARFFSRVAWRFFRGGAVFTDGAEGLFRGQTSSFHRCVAVVWAFYAVQFFDAVMLLKEWGGIMSRPAPDPLWPVIWLAWLPEAQAGAGVVFILSLYLFGSLGAVMVPGSRTARALAFLALLQWVAYNNSFGKIGHSMHLMIYVGFLLVFLPSGWNLDGARRAVRQSVLNVHWACLATIMLTYSLAGLIKVWVGLGQWAVGQHSLFSPDALARQVADRLIQTNSTSFLGEWFITYSGWTFLLMLPTVALEVLAFWAAFRPALRAPFALGLLMFHLASFFAMTIIFQHACALLVLFACVPLRGESFTWSQRIAALPGVGGFMKMGKRSC